MSLGLDAFTIVLVVCCDLRFIRPKRLLIEPYEVSEALFCRKDIVLIYYRMLLLIFAILSNS